ncbi:ecdysteroid kinase [Aureococcus anophagefferens]|nr:ecdysteroid kinase [Aureococcus anophagefferens]
MPVHVELADFIEAFFVKCWASVKAGGVYDLGAEAAALVDAVAAPGVYASLTRRLAEPPLTLLHGDFRAANLMVDEGGAVVVYDWQFAALGNGGYDLAYFVALSAPVDERRRRRARSAPRTRPRSRRRRARRRRRRTRSPGTRTAACSWASRAVIGAATAGDAPSPRRTRGLERLSAAALDWGAVPRTWSTNATAPRGSRT